MRTAHSGDSSGRASGLCHPWRVQVVPAAWRSHLWGLPDHRGGHRRDGHIPSTGLIQRGVRAPQQLRGVNARPPGAGRAAAQRASVTRRRGHGPVGSGRHRGSRRELRSGLARLGHRKLAAMMRGDGHRVSTSTVQRALRRRGPGQAAGVLRVRDRPRRDLADLHSHRMGHQVLPRRRTLRLACGPWQTRHSTGRS